MTCTPCALRLGMAALAAPVVRAQGTAFRFALLPVFLDNDAAVIGSLRVALAEGTGRQIDLVQRRTYQEISGALLDGSVDAARTCGFPYLQHRDRLALLGVPVRNGKPLYQSYLIVAAGDTAGDLADLRGGIHAVSDPDNNSGDLVTASDLMRLGETPEGFFARSIFTFGHFNVVRAVAGWLTRSGSVDGYVWEVLGAVEPDLTARTCFVARSDWPGFPPFVARSDRRDDPDVAAFAAALTALAGTASGRAALDLLYLDGLTRADPALFDGIAARMAVLGGAP